MASNDDPCLSVPGRIRNHTNWARPNLTFADPRFMTFAPTAAHQFNTIWGTGTRERTVQVGLRLEF
jgi:hypothetical protein